MDQAITFAGLMDELGQFQAAITGIQQGLRNEKHKAILGEALERFQQEKAKAELTIPPIFRQFQQKMADTRAELETESARIREKHKQLKTQLGTAQQKAKQTAEALPPKPKRTEPKVDPHLGTQLRTELLRRFGSPSGPEAAQASAIKEAWQDWQ